MRWGRQYIVTSNTLSVYRGEIRVSGPQLPQLPRPETSTTALHILLLICSAASSGPPRLPASNQSLPNYRSGCHVALQTVSLRLCGVQYSCCLSFHPLCPNPGGGDTHTTFFPFSISLFFFSYFSPRHNFFMVTYFLARTVFQVDGPDKIRRCHRAPRA